MATKTTIAIVGATESAGIEVAGKLASQNFRLLLISRDESKLKQLAEEILHHTPGADVEIINCVKEGCWEADIIVLAASPIPAETLIEKIKDVATQKIVVEIVQGSNSSATEALHRVLPYSKIVTASFITHPEKEVTITGLDKKAVQLIEGIAVKAGFKFQPAGV